VSAAGDSGHLGMTVAEWTAAVDEAELVLLAHARRGETVTYVEFMRELTCVRVRHPHSPVLPALLTEVDERTWARDGVMLGAIVHHAGGDHMRGNRFFETATRLGREVGDRRAFWEAEVAAVHVRYRAGTGGPDA
jgi:hypothetical protein